MEDSDGGTRLGSSSSSEERGGRGAFVSRDLALMFVRLEDADAKMRRIDSLEGRRTFARERLLPLLRKVDKAMRADGRASGEPEIVTDLRCDQHLRVFLAGLSPEATGGCDWTQSHCRDVYTEGYDEAAGDWPGDGDDEDDEDDDDEEDAA
jgi:hypothetical protein